MKTNGAARIALARLLCALLLLVALLPVARAASSFPLKIHAGTIERMERLETTLPFVKLEEAVASGEQSAPEIVPGWLREERPAPAGLVYVVFTVAVLPERSLSRFDYALEADGQRYPCLGMALEQGAVFDGRRLEQRGAGIVKIAFACPATASDAALVSRYHEVPLNSVRDIVLIEKEPAPEAAAVEPDAPAAEPALAETPAPEAAAAALKPVKKTAEKAAEKAAAKLAPKSVKKPAEKPAPKPAPKPADDIFTF
jgi:hypothetical protein